MKIPSDGKKLASWLCDTTDACLASQKTRTDSGAFYRQLYFQGSTNTKTAKYNKSFAHVERLSSYLFSPEELQLNLTFDHPDDRTLDMGVVAARHLSRKFRKAKCDFAFGSALKWSLIKNSCFVKPIWGRNGIEPVIIQPECFGVYREDVCGLDKQEAFTYLSFITISQLRIHLESHPDKQKMLDKLQNLSNTDKKNQFDQGYYHQIVVGGTNPVQPNSTGTNGAVQVFGTPTPQLAADTIADLIPIYETWVWDDEREDYTTFQFAKPDIIFEGALRRRNLFGVKGRHGFTQVGVNTTEGYFWNQSEYAPLVELQRTLNRRLNEIDRISILRANPPRAALGYSGSTDNLSTASSSPNGWITDNAPGGKIENLAPEMPPEAYENVNQIINYFDDIAGFNPILSGEGEAGVRSADHAETLVRTSAPRIRDRALLAEAQCCNFAQDCWELLRVKEAAVFSTDVGRGFLGRKQSFLLSQILDATAVIDSHSSSPALSNESYQKALALLKSGAIGPEEFMMLIQPPMQDILLERLQQRKAQEAQMIKEHPELLTKGKK